MSVFTDLSSIFYMFYLNQNDYGPSLFIKNLGQTAFKPIYDKFKFRVRVTQSTFKSLLKATTSFGPV
ncbi:hypothetical protein COLO4_13831 [Corchorus olitorius]|uniref:Uncharacterized protein n=1 Tax=Corchorus olitorius TaxID=93759 RepID=A0A1R3JUF6_9ROSI|nr:hypothetical protein COLO4_13831 [Corchorus olitorius]